MGGFKEREIGPLWYLLLGPSLISQVTEATPKVVTLKVGSKSVWGGLLKGERCVFLSEKKN